MKKIMFMLLFMLAAAINMQAQNNTKNYEKQGNTFVQTKTAKATAKAEKTNFFWMDSKENKYDIYISSNGRCFVYKTSKAGNEYKYYMSEALSREICSYLGMEYKETKNKQE